MTANTAAVLSHLIRCGCAEKHVECLEEFAPTDINQLAKAIVEEATGQKPKVVPPQKILPLLLLGGLVVYAVVLPEPPHLAQKT
jgi:hypothetical protein